MQLSSDSQFQLKTGMHPDLLTALTNVRSGTAKALLKPNVSLDGTGSHTGFKLNYYGEMLQNNTCLDPSDRLLLEHIQCALSNNPMIKKLVDAVTRQAAFVEKMDRQLWIRSPALEDTLQRAMQRYGNFLELFKMYPRKMLVPTLDIDLVWHTHQCSPAQYVEGTKKLAGRFIDHNDKLGNDKLDPGLENTIDLYRIRFAEEYEYCLCWDCEVVKSAVESKDYEEEDVTAIGKRLQSVLAYFRTVEIARRKGETLLPLRDENDHLVSAR